MYNLSAEIFLGDCAWIISNLKPSASTVQPKQLTELSWDWHLDGLLSIYVSQKRLNKFKSCSFCYLIFPKCASVASLYILIPLRPVIIWFLTFWNISRETFNPNGRNLYLYSPNRALIDVSSLGILSGGICKFSPFMCIFD